jgi:hypothetical protein
MYIVKSFTDEPPVGHPFSGSCLQASLYSRNLIVDNKSSKLIIRPAVAYHSYGEDLWPDPILIADEVPPNKLVSYDLDPLKIRISHYQLKFFIEEKPRRDADEGPYPWFIRCIVLTVQKDGGFAVGLVRQILPQGG